MKENPSPATRTFLDVIFKASIEAKDERALKQLLEHRLVDVNAPLFTSGEDQQTPIGRAASLQAYSLIETLLHYGADVNKTHARIMADRSALTIFIGSFHDRVIINLTSGRIPVTSNITKTVDLLVKAGVRVTLDDLKEAGRLFATYEIASRLSLAILPSEHRGFFQGSRHPYRLDSHIATTAQYSDDTQASQIIRNMIDLCKADCCGKCLVSHASHVEDAALEAAKLGHLKVVRLFINHVRLSTTIFCAAIRSRNKDLIDLVLFFKPDLNPQPRWADNGYELTSPLAEAIRVGNEELIQYLVRGQKIMVFLRSQPVYLAIIPPFPICYYCCSVSAILSHRYLGWYATIANNHCSTLQALSLVSTIVDAWNP